MAPTVGQTVHVFTTDVSRQTSGQGEGPYAGIVTQVFSGTCINARVFPAFADCWDTASVVPDGMPTRWAYPPA